MKKITAVSALSTLAVAALMASGHAAAQQVAGTNNATLNFQGAVTSATCTITSGTSPNLTYTLPTVSKTALDGAVGNTTGKTPFSIIVAGCSGTNNAVTPAPITRAVPYFDVTGPNVNVGGRLSNTVSGGSNADLQILDPVAGAVVLNAVWASVGPLPATTPQKVTTQDLTGTPGGATFNFYVQYYATNASTSVGLVTTSVPIIMQYY
jgi:major type 1 subunit fimbrin (pilin)